MHATGHARRELALYIEGQPRFAARIAREFERATSQRRAGTYDRQSAGLLHRRLRKVVDDAARDFTRERPKDGARLWRLWTESQRDMLAAGYVLEAADHYEYEKLGAR